MVKQYKTRNKQKYGLFLIFSLIEKYCHWYDEFYKINAINGTLIIHDKCISFIGTYYLKFTLNNRVDLPLGTY